MSYIEYSLFRIKFIQPPQTNLFLEDLRSEDLFLKALAEKPSDEKRAGYIWHIGNVDYFSENTGYFAIGRTTISTIDKFDSSTGNFIQEETEESPYTHCVFNAKIGFIGIAKKSGLAQTAKSIADRVEDLLATSRVVHERQLSVEILPIPDPEGFIRALDTALRVTRFSATFHGPNPFDADEHFQKPLSVYLQAAKGQRGRTHIQGENLNRKVLQDVTRSTAATGNEASARIIKGKSQRPITINLKGDPIKRRYADNEHDPRLVLADFTDTYHRVRNDQRD